MFANDPNLREEDDCIEELLEGDSSISVSIDDVEHLEDENVGVAHAQRRGELLL